MARLIFITFTLLLSQAFGSSQTDPLEGKWYYVSTRYQGIEQPRPNPDLQLFFEFEPGGENAGISKLQWYYSGQKGFCERKAQYQHDFSTIKEVVVWVNPENLPSCSHDPDMQLGKQAQTAFRISSGKLETDFNLGNSTITYIWEKQR